MAGIEDLTPAEQQQLRFGKMLLEANPELVMEAKKLAKKVNPNLKIPEVDLEEKLTAERVEREKLAEQIEKNRIEDRVRERELAAKKKVEDAGFTLEEIEKIVKDENCSIDTALRLAQLQHESGEPGAAEVRGFPGPRDIRPDADWRKFGTDIGALRRHSAEIAHQGIDELLQRARAARR